MADKERKGVAEANAAFVHDQSEARLKVRRIGNSFGVVLTKDLLARLGVGEGDTLAVTQTEDGVLLRAADDEVARQLAIGRELMVRYRHTFQMLAK